MMVEERERERERERKREKEKKTQTNKQTFYNKIGYTPLHMAILNENV